MHTTKVNSPWLFVKVRVPDVIFSSDFDTMTEQESEVFQSLCSPQQKRYSSRGFDIDVYRLLVGKFLWHLVRGFTMEVDVAEVTKWGCTPVVP